MFGFMTMLNEDLAKDNGESFLNKEAIMSVLCNINDLVMSDENLMAGVEHLLQNYAFAELSSTTEYMKARALLLYSKYKVDSFTD